MQISVESFRVKAKVCKLFLRGAVISTISALFPGTESVEGLAETIKRDRRGQHENSQKNIHRERSGLPTKSSMRNLRKCMDVFQMSLVKSKTLNPITQKISYMKAAFLTFTIPDGHTLLDSKKGYDSLLKHMIEFLIYHFGVDRYIWRFERQDRGQAHWHICVNHFCELYAVKTYWLHLLAKHGLTKDYYDRYDYDPSSAVVIEGIRNDNELAFYFNKYFNKKTQSDKPTAGRWWGADIVTKRMPLPVVPITERFTYQLDILARGGSVEVLDVKIEKERPGQDKVPPEMRKKDEYKVCTIIRPRKLPMVWLLCPIQRGIYDKYLALNRAGSVEGVRMLRNEVLDYDKQVQKWIEDRTRAKEDMEFLGRLKAIKGHSEKVITNRRRRKLLLARQRAREEEKAIGVSLFT